MKLVNLTFKRFPADTADAIYVRELSRAFTHVLKDEFLLVVGKNKSNELTTIPHHTIGFKGTRFRTVYYFFWIPWFVLRVCNRGRRVTFFSNDQFLLSALIVWRWLLFFPYRVCVDWHMQTQTWKDAFVARWADCHITTTEHLRLQLTKELNIPSDKVKTVYGGVSIDGIYTQNATDKSTLRTALQLRTDLTLVGYVGFFKTLGKEKGLRTMIDALAYIGDTTVAIVCAGGTKDEIAEYSQYAQQQGVRDRCFFIERVSSEEVAQYQQAMDLLVIPYPDEPHFRNFGFPMKTYEYMASGIPVIYSQLPIINEVLEGYGLPFQPGDAWSLASTIMYCKENEKEAEAWAHKARQKVQEFTWDRKAEAILEFVLQ